MKGASTALMVAAAVIAVLLGIYLAQQTFDGPELGPKVANLYVQSVSLNSGEQVDCVVGEEAIDCDFEHRTVRLRAYFETTPIPTPEQTSGPE